MKNFSGENYPREEDVANRPLKYAKKFATA